MMEPNDVTLMHRPTDATKEAEFSYFTSDIQDVQSKIKRKSYFRTSSSEKSLLCLYSAEGEEFMRYKPREITRISEPDKKYLCVEYGPKVAPMYMLLDFNDSSECMDEWENALRQMMGLETPFRDRSKSASVIRRPSTRSPKRAVSTFQQTNQPINTIPEIPAENNLRQPSEVETDVEARFTATTTDSQSSLDEDTRDRASSDMDNVSITGSEELSPFTSLKSVGEDEIFRRENKLTLLLEERGKKSVDHEVSIDELQGLTLSDYAGRVCVSDVGAATPHVIYIGDILQQVDSKNIGTAQEAMNLIRSLKEKPTQSLESKILVQLERFPNGNVCVIKSEEGVCHQLGIDLEGSKITSTLGEFRRACDPAWVFFKGERSSRSITGINDHAVSLYSTTQEVTELIKSALEEEMSIIVFHVHPTEFLNELTSSSSTNL
eukprot:XP_011660492.1 PREDICTED: uncharacterized protein LOC105436560 [Strongylocentrotus purpuratus]